MLILKVRSVAHGTLKFITTRSNHWGKKPAPFFEVNFSYDVIRSSNFFIHVGEWCLCFTHCSFVHGPLTTFPNNCYPVMARRPLHLRTIGQPFKTLKGRTFKNVIIDFCANAWPFTCQVIRIYAVRDRSNCDNNTTTNAPYFALRGRIGSITGLNDREGWQNRRGG